MKDKNEKAFKNSSQFNNAYHKPRIGKIDMT